MEPKPSVGRIVLYRLTAGESAASCVHHGAVRPLNNGAEVAPAIITRVFSDTCVNLRVLLDGPDTLWVTSANPGDDERQWQWPPREVRVAGTGNTIDSTELPGPGEGGG